MLLNAVNFMRETISKRWIENHDWELKMLYFLKVRSMNSFKTKSVNYQKTGSWEKASGWYNSLVQKKGHYYHEHVVLPGVLKMMNLKPGDRLLDLGCGNGVLARQIPKGVGYTGIDISASLVAAAKQQDQNKEHMFVVADATKQLPVKEQDF